MKEPTRLGDLFWKQIINPNGEIIFEKYWDSFQQENYDYTRIENEYEKYLVGIGHFFRELKYSILKLPNYITFLEVYPIPEYISNSGIGDEEYAHYHVSAFLSNVITLHDFLLKFVDHILRLGIPKKKINWYLLEKNTIYRETKLFKRLSTYSNDLKEIRELRNSLIHDLGKKMPMVRYLELRYHQSFLQLYYEEKKKGEIKNTKHIAEKFKKHGELLEWVSSTIDMVEKNNEAILNEMIPFILKQNLIFKLKQET